MNGTLSYLSYFHALERLQSLHRATPEEFSLWVMHGDIPTYDDEGCQCWVRDALPPVWRGSPAEQWDAVKSRLFNCRFRPSDLEAFEPGERWLTHAQLLERWAASLGTEGARLFIEAKAQTGGLLPVYPITGFEVEYPDHGVFRLGAVEILEPDFPEPRKPPKGEPPQFLTAQAIAGELSRDGVEIDAICARLLEAVQSGNLPAEVALRKPGAVGGFEPLTAITQIRQIHDYSLGHSWVMVTIHRKDYLPWAARNGLGVPKIWQEEAPEPEAAPAVRKTEINRWLYDTWEAKDKPTGAPFFKLLKAYKGKPGSPIEEFYPAGSSAGIKWKTSSGATGRMSRKRIQNMASEFKKSAKTCQ